MSLYFWLSELYASEHFTIHSCRDYRTNDLLPCARIKKPLACAGGLGKAMEEGQLLLLAGLLGAALLLRLDNSLEGG